MFASSAGSSATDCVASSYSTPASRTRLSRSSPNNFSRETLEPPAASAQSSSKGLSILQLPPPARQLSQMGRHMQPQPHQSYLEQDHSLTRLQVGLLMQPLCHISCRHRSLGEPPARSLLIPGRLRLRLQHPRKRLGLRIPTQTLWVALRSYLKTCGRQRP